MRVEVVEERPALAARAADEIAQRLRAAVRRRGQATAAFSGGSAPAAMLEALAGCDVPWPRVHVAQVDERAVGEADPRRNLALLRARLLDRVALPAANVHAMPVGGASAGGEAGAHASADLDAAAARYAATLERVCGRPAVLDVVHLGLGADGHTASLVPGDPVLDEAQRDVAATGAYQGMRRLTLTYPALRRARARVWLVAGADKARALACLLAGDPAIPAGRLADDRGVVLADVAPTPHAPG